MVADENVTLGSARPVHSMSTHMHPRGPPPAGRTPPLCEVESRDGEGDAVIGMMQLCGHDLSRSRLTDLLCHPGGRGGLDARLGASLNPRRRGHCSVDRVNTEDF